MRALVGVAPQLRNHGGRAAEPPHRGARHVLRRAVGVPAHPRHRLALQPHGYEVVLFNLVAPGQVRNE
ncbi:MAG: hypothetical protein R2713_03655 [Ilumatobacteraceae bacterium]